MSIPSVLSPSNSQSTIEEKDLSIPDPIVEESATLKTAPPSLSEKTAEAISPSVLFRRVADTCKIPFMTPALQERKTSKVQLSNGIQALVISDPNFKKSACALSVGVGSYDDPKEFGGLAHFTEHLSFLGSAKYPSESEFDEFLSSHGGYSNASTHDVLTNYYFDIDHDAFDEAISRFSDFFIQPLFKESGINNEVNAVDNEFTECTHHNEWLKDFVLKEFATSDHPKTMFDIGNKQSLGKVPRERVIQWHKENYSSNIMTLTICSPLPLEKLEKKLSHFACIENKNLEMKRTTAPVFDPVFEASMTFVKPIKEERELCIIRELPAEFAHMRKTSPHSIVATILGDESENSLLEQLKREDLAEKLSAGGEGEGPNSLIFKLSISLTEKGVKHRDTVIERCFQAIKTFQSLPEGIPQYIFEEQKNLATLNYQFQPFSNAATCAEMSSTSLVKYDLSSFPEEPFIPQEFDKQACQRLLDSLRPEKCLYMLSCNPEELAFENEEVQTWKEERWMKTKYHNEAVNPETISQWSTVSEHPSIKLAPPNPFIPTNFQQLENIESPLPKVPQLVLEEDRGSLYFMQDQKFLTPKIFELYSLVSPSLDSQNTKNRLLTKIFLHGINDLLNPIFFQASMSGIQSSGFSLSEGGISLSISGYNDKAELFLKALLEVFKEPIFSREKFESYKNSLIMDYKHSMQGSPLEQASDQVRLLLHDYAPRLKTCKKMASKLKYQDLQKFLPELFVRSNLQAFCFGNMNREQAISKYHLFQSSMVNSEPYRLENHKKRKYLALPEDMSPLFKSRRVDSDGNAAILLADLGSYTPENKAMQMLLLDIINTPLYDRLRTQLGLAYQVFPQSLALGEHLYSSFNISSNTHRGRDLITLIQMVTDQFISEMSTEEKGLSKEKFEQHKHGLLQTLNENSSLEKQGSQFSRELHKVPPDFERKSKIIQAMASLELEAFISFAKEHLGRTMKKRVGIGCDGNVSPEENLTFKKVKDFKRLRDEE
jgi:insulysin